jgi:hypothetical protein
MLHYGGGFDCYATRHFGVEAAVHGASLPFANRVPIAGPAATVMFGVFYRTK